QLLQRARQDLGLKNNDSQEVVVEFSRDVVHKLACAGCGAEEEIFAAVGTVAYARGRCPACGQMRQVITAHAYTGAETYGKRTLDQLGLPLFDVFSARSAERELAYLIAGDAEAVLGQASPAEPNVRTSGASQ